jgi:hypothetical protein
VLVQTHGVPGAIMINDKSIWDITLKSDFAGGGFHRLFPHYTMIYFDGCNCAKGSLGDEFLEAVGQIFLRNAGGEVRGWTSYGYGITWDVPFIGGHTIHFSGEAKTAYFRPGGVSYVPPRVKVEKEPIEHGFKI